jgi:hypothetical protein
VAPQRCALRRDLTASFAHSPCGKSTFPGDMPDLSKLPYPRMLSGKLEITNCFSDWLAAPTDEGAEGQQRRRPDRRLSGSLAGWPPPFLLPRQG